MIKISEKVKDIIDTSSSLKFGFYHGLFNLTQLSTFILPLIKASTKKEVTQTSLLMALSRLYKTKPAIKPTDREKFKIENLVIHTNLCVVTFNKTTTTHKETNVFYNKVQKREGYITITEGTTEITVIFNEEYLQAALEIYTLEPRRISRDVASIGVRFPLKYINEPGFLYQILQVLTFQNINIIELSSTATEIIVYLRQEDTRLAFDTLLACFKERKA